MSTLKAFFHKVRLQEACFEDVIVIYRKSDLTLQTSELDILVGDGMVRCGRGIWAIFSVHSKCVLAFHLPVDGLDFAFYWKSKKYWHCWRSQVITWHPASLPFPSSLLAGSQTQSGDPPLFRHSTGGRGDGASREEHLSPADALRPGKGARFCWWSWGGAVVF